jgi:glycosyltransferase involved in cell wall biosynthesis
VTTSAKPRILHVSTVHHPADPRLAFRVMPSLATAYALTAVLPWVKGSPAPAGVRVWWVGRFARVWWRLLLSYPAVLVYALRLRPALVHLYDPELIPMGLLLKAVLSVPIILEVHENLHKKSDQKARIHGRLALPFFRWFDGLARRHFHLILTEHGYLDTYTNLTHPATVVYNYPQLSFFEPFRTAYQPDPMSPKLFYIGLLSIARAFDTLVAGLAMLKNQYPVFEMHLFGEQRLTNDELTTLPGYDTVRDNLVFHGYTNQQVALQAAAEATLGLALLKPIGDYADSYPTKLFEYMALGLPVLTTDLPLNRAIVERHGCGLCVPADSPQALADALAWFIEHPEQARQMGERGRQAVEQHYNWDSEAVKLLTLYRIALNQQPIN